MLGDDPEQADYNDKTGDDGVREPDRYGGLLVKDRHSSKLAVDQAEYVLDCVIEFADFSNSLLRDRISS